MEGHSGPSPMTASISECVCLGIGPIMSSWSSDWVTSCIKAYVRNIFNVREYEALILASPSQKRHPIFLLALGVHA